MNQLNLLNQLNPLNHPAVSYLEAAAWTRYYRVRREDMSRGASAVEWVVITAILVTLAFAVGGVIYKAVQDKAKDLDGDIGKDVG